MSNPITIPRYSPSLETGVAVARFGDGQQFEVTRGRICGFPGLVGGAPATHCFYAAFAEQLTQEDIVWDVGSGSGHGTHILSTRAQVEGMDICSEVLAYSTRLCPHIRFHESLEALAESPPPTCIVLIDVLGFQSDPRQLLMRLRKAAGPNTRLLIAEPRANAGQTLTYPVRQAFTASALDSLLVQAGWTPGQWGAQPGSFIVGSSESAEVDVGAVFEELNDLDCSIDRSNGLLKELSAVGTATVELEAQLLGAQHAIAAGQGDRATELLLAALEARPGEPRALATLAQLALAIGDQQDAMCLAVEALTGDPNCPNAACAAALCADALAPDDSLSTWLHASALTPGEPEVLSQLAAKAAQIGDNPTAIGTLERLRDYSDEPRVDLHVTLGWLLHAEGRLDDAALEARTAITLAPGDPHVSKLMHAVAAEQAAPQASP